MRDVLESHGATIEKFIGDAVMAVFGVPRLHEDDALRAVRAAAAMQQSLAVLNDELDRRYGVRLASRTGVNTGEVIAGDPAAGQRLVTGDAVNVAARLEQAAGAARGSTRAGSSPATGGGGNGWCPATGSTWPRGSSGRGAPARCSSAS